MPERDDADRILAYMQEKERRDRDRYTSILIAIIVVAVLFIVGGYFILHGLLGM